MGCLFNVGMSVFIFESHFRLWFASTPLKMISESSSVEQVSHDFIIDSDVQIFFYYKTFLLNPTYIPANGSDHIIGHSFLFLVLL